MPYKLTPGEIKQLWAAYCRACNSNMAAIRRGGKRVLVPRPLVYDMAGFCAFAGIDPATLRGMAADPHYLPLINEIRCAVLVRKLRALAKREHGVQQLVPELRAVYGLYAAKKQGTAGRYWQVRFNPNAWVAGGQKAAAPAAHITRQVLEKRGFIFF